MDLLTGMRTYIAVVKAGSFTRAADALGISKALTSKYVNQLETHLGVRLLQRTTRRLHLTDSGQSYYEQAQHIIEELDNLETALFAQSQDPVGRIKLTAPVTFGELYLTPLLATYLKLYPRMNVELELSDRFVNLIEEGFDLAIRMGELKDSSLIAKRLAQTRLCVYVSPIYLQQHPIPLSPQDLDKHLCILDSNLAIPDKWQFRDPKTKKQFTVKIEGRFQVNSASAVKQMILSHQGVGMCPAYLMGESLNNNQVVQLFSTYPAQNIGIYAIYSPQKYLPFKTRSMIDFLEQNLKQSTPWE